MAIGDYTDKQVSDWMQGKTPDQVAAQAASLGLSAGQVQEAYGLIGTNYSTNDITNYGTSHGYKFDPTTGAGGFRSQAASDAFSDSKRGQVGGQLWNFETNRNIYNGNATDANSGFTPQQVKEWFAANPNASNEQLAQMASQYHMTPEGVAQALSIGRGVAYDPQAVRNWLGGQKDYLIENDGMISAPGHRSNGLNGATGVNTPFGQYGADGKGYAKSSGVAYGSNVGIINGASGTGGTGGTGNTGGSGSTDPGSTVIGSGVTPVGGGSIYQAGQTTGTGTGTTTSPWATTQQPGGFNTPALNALYNSQQQRMTSPAPQFNFGGKAVQGPLTQAIKTPPMAGTGGGDPYVDPYAMGTGFNQMNPGPMPGALTQAITAGTPAPVDPYVPPDPYAMGTGFNQFTPGM